MKASQAHPPSWFSRPRRGLMLCCAGLLTLSACGLQPTQPTTTPSLLAPTPTPKPTETLSPTPTPTAAPTKIVSATPTEIQGCLETKGKLVQGEFESLLLGKPINFQLYLPACFGANPGLRYPVLYLLHGLYSNETQWELIGLPESMDAFVETTKLPFIVVMPRVPDSDSQAKAPIHQVIPEELVPHIDQNYPTLTEREFRAIGGISRGASLSLRIGYEHHELFGKVGMHSLPMLVDESTFYAKALGKLDNPERPLLFLDSGNDDRDLAVARHFDIELTKLAIPHTWYMFYGYHDEIYWSEHLLIYLEWYAQGW